MGYNYTNFSKSNFNKTNTLLWMVLSCFLIANASLKAEGIQDVAPSSSDVVMLLIGDDNYGNFATSTSPESSRLYVQFSEPGEVLYLGLSREYTESGNAAGTGNYSYIIRRASDGNIVHGPHSINSFTENISSWEDASGPAVLNGGVGYDTDLPLYYYEADAAGLYYIEFTSANYIGLWDFTVANNGVEVPGRVFSKNWAFRTPRQDNTVPECVWDRPFNGALYSYTSDGFVTRLDFADSGLQGLSFTMAFNSKGPGLTGDIGLDRMSIADANIGTDFAEHLVFLSEPDASLFPNGTCGEISVAPYFQCTSDGAYCLDLTVTQPGQLEVVIDVNNNNVYEEGLDRRLLYRFNEGDNFNHCLYWDGLIGDGTTIAPGATVNLLIQYTQGIQHWSVFDAEFLKDGFCVQPVRPICNTNNGTDFLYWDDRNLPESPGTGQPKDGTNGCDCETVGCRTWNNFDPHTDDCSQIDDNITTGYGDKNIINTWWFANVEELTLANVPLIDVVIQGEQEVCENATTNLTYLFTSSADIANIVWTGPNGIIAEGVDAPQNIQVNQVGTYSIQVTDVNGCSYTDTHDLMSMVCSTDVELDITVNELTPAVCDTVDFTVSLSNVGDMMAANFEMSTYWTDGITNIHNISHGGQWNGTTIVWNNINLAIGEGTLISFSAKVSPSFDYVISAEITDFPQGDTDSTPNNGVDTDNDDNCADDAGDEDDGDCVILTPDACNINASISDVLCNANSTFEIADDDIYTFDLTVTGGNGELTWSGNVAGLPISGHYGETQTFGPYEIADGNVSISVNDDFFTTSCIDNVTAIAPSTCSNQCLILLEEGEITCSDNGTSADASDDTYTVAFRLSGFNIGNTWVASDGTTGAYDTWVTYGPYNISDGNTTLTFSDDGDDSCDLSHTFTAPASCSTDCLLQGTIGEVICSDNGTPSDASDDTYTFLVNIEAYNIGVNGWEANDVLASRGSYTNEPIEMGPYNIIDGDVSFQITDVDQVNCSIDINVIAPITCSNVCDINVELGEQNCLNNDTPSDASDDMFTIDVRLTGFNTATQWIASNSATGNYGEWVTLGPFPISEGDVNLTFVDSDDDDCSTSAVLQAPSSCSNTCVINTSVSTAICTNNGTPSDPSDDTFSFILTVNGNNLSTGWSANDTHTSQGAYSTAVLMGPYPIADGTVVITISDNEDGNCTDVIEVDPPETCSNLCDINVSQSGVTLCFDNNTPTDASDDQFNFAVIVTGSNIGSQWTASNGQTGNYNEPTFINGFSIADGMASVTFTDNIDPNCQTSISIAPPNTCSNTCDVTSVEVTNILCSDNGTPIDPSDDTFTFDVAVNGLNLSSQWISSLGQNGAYGQVVNMGPFVISDGEVNVMFTDSESENCTNSISVTPPTSCSDECAIATEVTNIQCLDNNTPFDSDDDLYTFDLLVTSINHTAENWVSGTFGGLYGEVQTQGPFLIADGTLNMVISDADDIGCSSEIQVIPPATCSDDCLLSIEVVSTYCDDLGTELDATDDLFTYTIRVTGVNGGNTWTASDGTVGNYGEDIQSVGHSYAEGELNITVTDDLIGCSSSFTVSPPAPSLLCPEDTDERDFRGSVQVIQSYLGDSTDLRIPEAPCFLGLRSRPMTIADRFMEPIDILTPGVDTSENVYTFYFFSDIDPPSVDPLYNADGAGSLFRGDYTAYADPCCFNINHSDTIANDNEILNDDLIIENPFVDTTGMLGPNMHLVQRFTHSLKTNQVYSLVTTTFDVEATGNYAWVIVSEEVDEPMEVNAEGTTTTTQFYPDEDLSENLTFLMMSWIQNNPYESQEFVGSPIVEPYCGADSLYLNDELVFNDSCSAAIIQRSYYLEYGEEIDSCLQEITFRRPEYDDIVLPPATVTLECNGEYPLNANGFPDPLATGYPLLSVDNEYVPMYDTTAYFNLAISYKDIPQTDTTGLELNLLREWTVTDFCTGDTLYYIPQLIKIGDFELPTIRCPLTDNCACPNAPADVMLFDVDPNTCTGTIDIPEPIISSFCDGDDQDRLENWFVVTELLLANDSSLVDSIYTEEEDRSVANLVRGDYIVRYSMEDDFGHRVEQICQLRISDFQVPTALCKNTATILLSEIETTRVYPQDIDLGSYDNCDDTPLLEIRRYYDANALNCELLDEEGYGEWSPFVDFNCCDESASYLVELRVMDLDSNQNGCNTLIEVIDDVAPELYGLNNVEMPCSDLPFNFDPTDSLQLVELFGYPLVDDNCLADNRELVPEITWTDCDFGSIRRRFQATDRAGNTAATPYEQTITVVSDNSYGIRFEADKVAVCLEEVEDPAFRSGGCGVFEMSHEDVELPTLPGECLRIQRTYHIINSCDYDGVSEPIEINRNEDCDGSEGEENVWLVIDNNAAYIDADSLSNNTYPQAGEQGTDCTSNTNPEGYWRGIDNVGYWTYTQVISIQDGNAPIVSYDTPEPFCSVDERCVAMATVLVNVQADCTTERVDVSLWFDQDADGSLDQELTDTEVLGGSWPNYRISGEFPLGHHAFVFRAIDGCENETIERIDFDAVDCYIETPICKTAIEVQLTPIVPATDLNGDGILDEAAYIQAAALLVEEMLVDCSNDYLFSVNKVNDTIDFIADNLILTCEDRYTAIREVVVRDNAMNPYSVQPDGSIGGPNYSTCLIEISVQDEQEICRACVENELEIEGIIVTSSNEPIDQVDVRLFENDEFLGEQFTIPDGKFEFTDLTLSTDFEVIPFKNDDTRNGVTTIDMIILQRHLLLLNEITDPYVLLAADVNNSGAVTVLDLITIRRLLLNQIDEFPNNTSWRFIPSDFSLVDISADIPNSYSYFNLNVCQFAQDFVGIKIGDLNGSVNLAGGSAQGTLSSRTNWDIQINDFEMKEGGLFRVPIYMTDINKASGAELNLDIDLSLLSIVEVEPGLITREEMDVQNLANGKLKAIWLAEAEPSETNVLMTLVVKAASETMLSEAIQIDQQRATSAVFDLSLSSYKPELSFIDGAAELILLGNAPDPFRDFTELEFYLPKAGEVTVEIHDVNGKLLQTIVTDGLMGNQSIKLLGNQFTPGVLHYSLTFNGMTISRRMIKL